MTSERIQLAQRIDKSHQGQRLDCVLALLWPHYSRSLWQQWIKQQQVLVNGSAAKPRQKLQIDDLIEVDVTLEQQGDWQAQEIALDILYEDEDLLVINKPVGLVVHPGAGNPDQTLLNALLFHLPQLQQVPRAGIVHRLDKDTSGILMIAKSLTAHTHLVEQLQQREVKRQYLCLVNGTMTSGGTIDAAIGRHPHTRTKMALHELGKPAITHYRIKQRYAAHTLLEVHLETGRTHQIRVHMSSLGYPIVGDKLYGQRVKLPKQCPADLKMHLQSFNHQALHAQSLTFTHPLDHESLSFHAPLPKDFQLLINLLEQM